MSTRMLRRRRPKFSRAQEDARHDRWRACRLPPPRPLPPLPPLPPLLLSLPPLLLSLPPLLLSHPTTPPW
jgi:hypothetical protein